MVAITLVNVFIALTGILLAWIAVEPNRYTEFQKRFPLSPSVIIALVAISIILSTFISIKTEFIERARIKKVIVLLNESGDFSSALEIALQHQSRLERDCDYLSTTSMAAYNTGEWGLARKLASRCIKNSRHEWVSALIKALSDFKLSSRDESARLAVRSKLVNLWERRAGVNTRHQLLALNWLFELASTDTESYESIRRIEGLRGYEPFAEGRALRCRAVLATQRNLFEARNTYEKAIRASWFKLDIAESGRSAFELGEVLLALGLPREAQTYYEHANYVFKKFDRPYLYRKIQNGLAYVLKENCDRRESLRVWRSLIALVESDKKRDKNFLNPSELSSIYLRYGNTLLEALQFDDVSRNQKNYNKVSDAFNKAMFAVQIHDRPLQWDDEGPARTGLANLNAILGNYETSCTQHLEIIRRDRESTTSDVGLLVDYANIATTCSRVPELHKNAEEALGSLERILSRLRSEGETGLAAELITIVTEAYYYLGKHEKSDESWEELNELCGDGGNCSCRVSENIEYLGREIYSPVNVLR